jgi:protein TonB
VKILSMVGMRVGKEEKKRSKFQFLILVVFSGAMLAAAPGAARAAPQGAAPPTVRVGGNIKPPIKIKDVKPEYPALAMRQRMQGVIILEATIGTDGKVKDTKVIRSLPLLTEAAVTAVRGWEFKPTVVDGHPVQVIATFPINFSLQ